MLFVFRFKDFDFIEMLNWTFPERFNVKYQIFFRYKKTLGFSTHFSKTACKFFCCVSFHDGLYTYILKLTYFFNSHFLACT